MTDREFLQNLKSMVDAQLGTSVIPPPAPPPAPGVLDTLRPYLTIGPDAARDGLPANLTGTRRWRQYVRGSYWAAESQSQGTEPDVPSFAFQNFLNLYGSAIAALDAGAAPSHGTPVPTTPTPR